ncbi:ABC transporter substrate-binding protein [Collinsella sp. AGMB00827]|uniref:ABC transporter substrate-binding protein n=1 Tax=Collinsella ureilytica TaxID=2869515 RepID=A0ABS7MIT6_9ACTN|nr:ABC transporter substrate-binding protein [Collinsella urealyticum]MBY4797280.1 ABC transporter substrate-binding protein [Collinsella urealyticum]
MKRVRMMSRRGFLVAGLAATGMVASSGLAGCGFKPQKGVGSNSASGNADPELKMITFALDWTPNTNHTGLYVARERGYYREAGLDVEIVQAPENGADALVASGDAQFGVSFQDSMAGYVSGDAQLPVSAVAAIIQHNTSGIISLADRGITSPAKMMDHTYATWEMLIEQGIIKRCVEADGGVYDRVKLIPSTVTDEVSALSSGEVDSIWIFWGWAGEKCKLAGLDTSYFSFESVDKVFDYYTPVIIANNMLIKDDPKTVQAFMDATRRGYEDCIQDPDAAAEILLKAAPELERELVVASQHYLAEQYRADAPVWGLLDQKRWDAFYAWVSEQGFAPTIAAGAGMTDAFITA